VIRVPLRVTFRDGQTADVSGTQYSLAEYGLWCARHGIPPAELKEDRTATIADMHQLRFMAWAELQRDAPVKLTFEAWNRTVDEVASPEGTGAEGTGAAAVDPTGAGTPAG
jgi:hypothetical protein